MFTTRDWYVFCMPAMLSKAHTDFHMSLCLSVRESVHIET